MTEEFGSGMDWGPFCKTLFQESPSEKEIITIFGFLLLGNKREHRVTTTYLASFVSECVGCNMQQILKDIRKDGAYI